MHLSLATLAVALALALTFTASPARATTSGKPGPARLDRLLQQLTRTTTSVQQREKRTMDWGALNLTRDYVVLYDARSWRSQAQQGNTSATQAFCTEWHSGQSAPTPDQLHWYQSSQCSAVTD